MKNKNKNKKTILLVEDEPVTAKAAKKILEKHGYKVIHAHNGENAYNLFNKHNDIDLILMDIDLGDGIDGTDTAITILKERTIPIVFLSSHTEPEMVEKTEKITSYGYVVKNTGITVLDASIKMAFKLFAANQRSRRSEDLLYAKNSDLVQVNEELNATIEELEAANEELITTNEQLVESENALELSEKLYRSLFNLVPVAVGLSKLEDGKMVDVNEAYTEIFGLPREKIIGNTTVDLGMWVDAAERDIVRAELSKNGEFKNRDLRFNVKGEIHPALQSARIVEISGTKYIVAVTQDVSERKKAEAEINTKNEELRAVNEEMEASNEELVATMNEMLVVENRYRSVVENSFIGIAIVNDIYQYIYVNEEFCSIAGYMENEILGKNFTFLLSEESKDLSAERYKRRQNGEDVPSYYEFSFIQKNGSRRIGEVRSAVYKDLSGKVNSLIQVIDITDRRKIEVEFQESESRYRGFFDLAVDGILLGSHEGIILNANESMSVITGIARKDFIGKHISQLDFTKASLEKSPFRFDLLQKGEIVINERGFIRPDGSEVVVEMHSKMMPDGTYQSIYHDITARRIADDKIQNLLVEKDLILREVHHRIKNNMNTINSLLILQADTLKDPLAIAALEDAGNRVHSMMVLYDKLYKAIDFKEISVLDYIPSLLDEIVANFPNNKFLKIETKIDDFILDVKRIQPLGIIINELITNIMKYVITGRQEELLTVSAVLRGDQVVVEIIDYGTGIPESINFTNSTGFGLRLVSMLTEQIGGSIRIERDRGTKFILEFALRQAQ